MLFALVACETIDCGQNMAPEGEACVCIAGTYLLPDGKACSASLLYSVLENGQFACKAGLVYDTAAKKCVPESGSWFGLIDVCTSECHVVLRDGSGCVEACPGETPVVTEGVCMPCAEKDGGAYWDPAA